jgi:uncharacterized tellurite resistance protein B-like protein
MSNDSHLIMALAKVVIASAWADDDLAPEEINSLKDLLFHIPKLDAQQWAELDIYIDSPVGPDERERLVEDLRRAVHSRAERQLAVDTLEDLIQADGEIDSRETVVLEQVKDALGDNGSGLLGSLQGLVGAAVDRRSRAAGPNREAYLEDFVKNRVFYTLERKLDSGELKLSGDLAKADVRKMALAAGLMAHIAHLDGVVEAGERDVMAKAVQENWGLNQANARLVAEIAVTKTAADLDFFRLTREFHAATDRDERRAFARVLFQVAAADGHVSFDETEAIRSISRILKLTHKEFIDAKLSIPAELRNP